MTGEEEWMEKHRDIEYEGGRCWSLTWAVDQDTRARPNSLETHIVRKLLIIAMSPSGKNDSISSIKKLKLCKRVDLCHIRTPKATNWNVCDDTIGWLYVNLMHSKYTEVLKCRAFASILGLVGVKHCFGAVNAWCFQENFDSCKCEAMLKWNICMTRTVMP